ncbi:MAG: hypothetical protein AAGF24_06110 [Cyanobacteria bacterium P01_H01_bin.121]
MTATQIPAGQLPAFAEALWQQPYFNDIGCYPKNWDCKWAPLGYSRTVDRGPRGIYNPALVYEVEVWGYVRDGRTAAGRERKFCNIENKLNTAADSGNVEELNAAMRKLEKQYMADNVALDYLTNVWDCHWSRMWLAGRQLGIELVNNYHSTEA